MKKKTVVTAVIFVILIALVGIGAAFAFFSNESDSSYLTVDSNDQFSISIGIGETQGQLVPVKAVNDNTAAGNISDSDGVRIDVPYVIGEAEEGVTAMKVVVYASGAVWRGADGEELPEEIQAYMQGKLDLCLYDADALGEGEQPSYNWSNASAVFNFTDPTAGATGTLQLAIRFNVTDELLPEEIMNSTVTVSVTSEFVRT